MGGYGGLVKGMRAKNALKEKGYNVKVATVSNGYQKKMADLGMEPDIILNVGEINAVNSYTPLKKALYVLIMTLWFHFLREPPRFLMEWNGEKE